MEATYDNDLIIDLALGCGFGGSGVPTPYNEEYLEYDIQPFHVNVPIGGSYNGTLPGWTLISASTALVLTASNNSRVASIVSASSLTEVTGQINANGQISLTFPKNATGATNALFAFYLIQTHQRQQVGPIDLNSFTFPVKAGVPQSQPPTFRQNGSNVWDHFTIGGANIAINYWNEYLLTGETAHLLKKVGNYLWEDSIVCFFHRRDVAT